MPKLNFREQRILSAALLVMGLLAVDRLVCSPLRNGWRQLGQTIATKHRELIEDRRLLAEREKIKKEYASFSPSWREGGEETGSRQITKLLREIESVARRSGLKVSDLKPQGHSVHLIAESTWDSLARFIYEVQKSPQLLEIEKASVQRQGNEETRLTGQFVIGGVE